MPPRSEAPPRDTISVIIPALNEEERIGPALRRLRDCDVAEVIVVDGGSSDGTAKVARAMGATVLRETANRGRQQNAGAQSATGTILLFLHADTILPAGFADQVRSTLAKPGVSAGAFQFRLDALGWKFRLVERIVALRCRLFRLPYGDQAIFVSNEMFERAGSFSDLPIMEDFDLIRRLGRLGRVELADGEAVTSARRWSRLGVWRTTWTHQLCILGYYFRVSPNRLVRLRGDADDRRATF